jgi:hypothetical protein
LVSSSLTAAGRVIPQWTEDIPGYSWNQDGDYKTKQYITSMKEKAEVLYQH